MRCPIHEAKIIVGTSGQKAICSGADYTDEHPRCDTKILQAFAETLTLNGRVNRKAQPEGSPDWEADAETGSPDNARPGGVAQERPRGISLRELAGMVQGVRWRGDDQFTFQCLGHEDRQASASATLKNGKILLKCFAGCSVERIIEPLGLTLARLFSSAVETQLPARRSGPQIRYQIKNVDGAIVAVHVREDGTQGKRMWWELPDGRTGLGGIATVDLPLYGIERIPADGDQVLVTEGEKAAAALQRRGFAAVGTVTGASSCPADTAWAPLMGRELILWPDDDEQGRKHMARVATRLAGLGIGYRIISWPDAPPKGDAADFQGSNDDIDRLIAAESPVPVGLSADPAIAKPAGAVWGQAITAADFIAQADSDDTNFMVKRIVAPGSVTLISGTRGLGKTNLGLALAVAAAKGSEFLGEQLAPAPVLILNRDNPTRTIRNRLKSWGAAAVTNLFILGRDKAPPFADKGAWKAFPVDTYKVLIIDSHSAFVEGVDEKEGGVSGEAVASILDAAAKSNVAVVLLANTSRGGKAFRGSGVVADRSDIIYEARDATDLKLDPKKNSWVDCLPDPSDAAWGERAKRRTGRLDYRVAMICSKFRDGDEPEPFIIEIKHDDEAGWSVAEVTAEVENQHESIKQDAEAGRKQKVEKAIAALKAALPCPKNPDAIDILMAQELSRARARWVIADGAGRDWAITGTGRKRDAVMLRPYIYTESPAGMHGNETYTERSTSERAIPAALGPHKPQEFRFKNDSPPKASRIADSCGSSDGANQNGPPERTFQSSEMLAEGVVEVVGDAPMETQEVAAEIDRLAALDASTAGPEDIE